MGIYSSSMPVAQRLEKLAKLYQQGQASDLMTQTLDKLMEYEANISREQLAEIQKDMAEFEARYGMTSSDFYLRFQAGEADDRMDYVEWASLVQMAENLKHRIELLSSKSQP